MNIILDWLPWLGFGGVATLLIAVFLVPSLLPMLVVNVVKGGAEAVAALIAWLGSIILDGSTHIFKNHAAVFTLIFGVIAGGWAGDRYEFVRPYIPEMFRSEPGQVKAVRAQEAAKFKARQKQAAAPKSTVRNTRDQITCALLGNCTR